MNVYVLELKFDFEGAEKFIYPVILKNDHETILVDCGYEGFMPLIEKAANKYNISLEDLTGIIVTHHDIDHYGGLFEIKEKYPRIKVYSSKIEEPYISGKRKSLRLQQAEDLYSMLPPDKKEWALNFQQTVKSVKAVAVDEVFENNDEPSFLNEIKIISTPGHMPGHISIYCKDSKTLIAADAVVIENGNFELANPAFTLNMKEAINSVVKLSQLQIDKMICYHGGVLDNKINEKLRKLIDDYRGEEY